MSNEKKEDPNVPAPVWAAMVNRVQQIEHAQEALASRIEAVYQHIDGTLRTLAQGQDIIYHLIRTSRNESRDEFRQTLYRAQLEMQAPPEADAIASLRAEVEALKRQLAAKPATVVVPVELVQDVEEKPLPTTTAVDEPAKAVKRRNRPQPSDFAPANIVPPPAHIGGERDGDASFRTPPTASFRPA